MEIPNLTLLETLVERIEDLPAAASEDPAQTTTIMEGALKSARLLNSLTQLEELERAAINAHLEVHYPGFETYLCAHAHRENPVNDYIPVAHACRDAVGNIFFTTALD